MAKYADDLRDTKQSAADNELRAVGLTVLYDIAPYYELLSALAAGGYVMNVNNMEGFMPNVFDYLYYDNSLTNEHQWTLYDEFLRSDLSQLLSLTTPFIFPHQEELFYWDTELEHIPYNRVISDDPVFVWYSVNNTHMGSVWAYDPYIKERDTTAIHVYDTAYEHAANHILSFADSVRSYNPDAVIIIQGDHGFHYEATQEFIVNSGKYNEQEIFELINSVISAVYIPEKYGGVDAPVNPLNITRILVNRFVGENYTLLD